MNKHIFLVGILGMLTHTSLAQRAPKELSDTTSSNHTDSTTLLPDQSLKEVQVVTRMPGTRRVKGALNASLLTQSELFKAACCNLGESFTTNPSVDVSYNDAATGAKEIKLLGLSGKYVQMLTENMPNFRGAAIPYSLGYVPGTWLKSIQVSKGNASVKNGYEAMTGQINVQYLQPEDDQALHVNLYGNTMSRVEANVDGNVHLSKGLSTEVLGHYEDNLKEHDSNKDGFIDDPQTRQFNLQNRWFGKTGNYIFHGGLSLLDEKRESGQTNHSGVLSHQEEPLYRINVNTHRYEGYMKHAFILDADHGTNIALMSSASMHLMDADYGRKAYSVNEKNVYSQLMFETNFTPEHNLALGASFNHDYLGQTYLSQPVKEKENVVGAYAQYTFNLHERFVAMAGLRVDHSSEYGTFFTPRFHVKWQVNDILGLRASVGKGYRTVHALAENNYLMASGRQLVIDKLDQEDAWNYGLSAALNIPIAHKTLRVNAEYYYTHFGHQAIIDYDSEPTKITITNLNGKSYSHTFQVDASYDLFRGMTVTAAYRYNDVKTTYGGELLRKPLTSKYKGLLTASYKTPLGLWQLDATLALNGGGRMPKPYTTADGTPSWKEEYPAFAQVNAQITRWFRKFSVYVGGENLTDYKQKNPIINASHPWSDTFDPTLVWGPMEGARAYIGIRYKL